MSGDRSKPDGLAALGDQRFDAVVDMSAYFSDWTRAAAEALAGRVSHYVFISSGAVYRPLPELPWSESTPFGPIPMWGDYGNEKVASERILWDAYAEGRFAVTAFRFPFILGPGNFADRESFVFGRLAAGRPILLPGGGSALNQFVYAEDVARAIVDRARAPRRRRRPGLQLHLRQADHEPWLGGALRGCPRHGGADSSPIDEAELGVACRDRRSDQPRLPLPGRALRARRHEADARAGSRDDHPNRRMIEEYAAWWETLTEKPALRSYERENAALTALGLPTI